MSARTIADIRSRLAAANPTAQGWYDAEGMADVIAREFLSNSPEADAEFIEHSGHDVAALLRAVDALRVALVSAGVPCSIVDTMVAEAVRSPRASAKMQEQTDAICREAERRGREGLVKEPYDFVEGTL